MPVLNEARRRAPLPPHAARNLEREGHLRLAIAAHVPRFVSREQRPGLVALQEERDTQGATDAPGHVRVHVVLDL
ncbi:hypothetical protein, partial [Comamonas sp. JC664]|uniref:hypothetical protein n=1 Tax=Comamonas sp. JC664 TaxID=2801917 RepID=UPI001E2BCDBE